MSLPFVYCGMDLPLRGLQSGSVNPPKKPLTHQIIARGLQMVAYEFYYVDGRGEAHFFAILPERRKKPERITEKSIMDWGSMVIKGNRKAKTYYFIQVEIPEKPKHIKKYQ